MKNQCTDKWDYSAVETALCLWEAVLNLREACDSRNTRVPCEAAEAIDVMFDNHGSFTMRAVIACLADDCDQAWAAREALNGDDHIAFDFDFCPEFILGALKSGLIERSISAQYGGDTDAVTNGGWKAIAA